MPRAGCFHELLWPQAVALARASLDEACVVCGARWRTEEHRQNNFGAKKTCTSTFHFDFLLPRLQGGELKIPEWLHPEKCFFPIPKKLFISKGQIINLHSMLRENMARKILLYKLLSILFNMLQLLRTYYLIFSVLLLM